MMKINNFFESNLRNCQSFSTKHILDIFLYFRLHCFDRHFEFYHYLVFLSSLYSSRVVFLIEGVFYCEYAAVVILAYPSIYWYYPFFFWNFPMLSILWSVLAFFVIVWEKLNKKLVKVNSFQICYIFRVCFKAIVDRKNFDSISDISFVFEMWGILPSCSRVHDELNPVCTDKKMKNHQSEPITGEQILTN